MKYIICKDCKELKPNHAKQLCNKCYLRRFHKKHPNKHKEYYQKHGLSRLAYMRCWKKSNKDKIRIQQKQFRSTKEGKEYRSLKGQEYKKIRELEKKAREMLNNAIARKEVPKVRTLKCSICGNPAREYHHPASITS